MLPGVEAKDYTQPTVAYTEAVYDMLVNHINAHGIVWETWNAKDKSYFENVVIPVVNKHAGAVKNTTCPWS